MAAVIDVVGTGVAVIGVVGTGVAVIVAAAVVATSVVATSVGIYGVTIFLWYCWFYSAAVVVISCKMVFAFC